MDLLLRGGTIVTMDPERRVLEGDLLIRDGKIVALGAISQATLSASESICTVDCRGRVVIPGLVQSHVHLCQTLFRGHADELELLDWLRERIWPFEGLHSKDSLRASAKLGIAELLLSGTTAIQDMGTVHHTEQIFEVAAESGIRMLGGKAMMDVSRGVPASLRESMTASLDESDALRAKFDGAEAGRLAYAYNPRFVLSCTEPLLREVAARMQDGARVHTHASENQEELEAVRERCGMANVEYFAELGLLGERVGLAHCIWLTAREQRLLAETGTHLLHCPSSNLKLASGVAKIPELMAMGVNVSIGADGAPCSNSLDIWNELRLAALIHLPRVGASGFHAASVFELATLGGARALGMEDRIGSLEVGKRGDAVILNLQHAATTPKASSIYGQLVYSGSKSNVETVIVEGKTLVDHGVLMAFDEQELVSEASQEAVRIISSLS